MSCKNRLYSEVRVYFIKSEESGINLAESKYKLKSFCKLINNKVYLKAYRFDLNLIT